MVDVTREGAATAASSLAEAFQDAGRGVRGTAKQRFLRSGALLFWSRGYVATSMADIAAAAESSAGNFYNFFSGKEALLIAVLEEYQQRLQDVVDGSLGNPPLARIALILDAFRQILRATDFRIGGSLGRLAHEVADSDAAQKQISQALSAFRREIGRCLMDAETRAGQPIDVDEVATFVVAVLEGGVTQAQAERDLGPLDASIRQLRSYLDGLFRS